MLGSQKFLFGTRFLYKIAKSVYDVQCTMTISVVVTVVASTQYWALADKAFDAFYKLTNTKEQVQSYVLDGMVFHYVTYFI